MWSSWVNTNVCRKCHVNNLIGNIFTEKISVCVFITHTLKKIYNIVIGTDTPVCCPSCSDPECFVQFSVICSPFLGTVFCWRQGFWPSWSRHGVYFEGPLLHTILWPSGWPAGCSSGSCFAPGWASWPVVTRAGGTSPVCICVLDKPRKSLNLGFILCEVSEHPYTIG